MRAAKTETINLGKKKPQLLPQVHSEDGSIDVDLARVLQFHYNAAKRIPPFCYSKLSFNFSALSGFEPLLTKLFMVYRQIDWPFPKTWSADVDIALLAVSEVFSRPKNRVCQYTRRIVTKASSIGFNGCLQRGAFVESIPSQILYAEIAVDNAHFNLGTKLDRGILLSPYDWSHPRLAQTDNALVDPMRSFFEHFFLLCIEHFYYKKPFLQFCRKLLPQFLSVAWIIFRLRLRYPSCCRIAFLIIFFDFFLAFEKPLY